MTYIRLLYSKTFKCAKGQVFEINSTSLSMRWAFELIKL